MKFEIIVTYRLDSERGKEFHDPNWKPHTAKETLYVDTPILKSEIENLIKERYWNHLFLVDKIEILE